MLAMHTHEIIKLISKVLSFQPTREIYFSRLLLTEDNWRLQLETILISLSNISEALTTASLSLSSTDSLSIPNANEERTPGYEISSAR